jgi:hypothetical protein
MRVRESSPLAIAQLGSCRIATETFDYREHLAQRRFLDELKNVFPKKNALIALGKKRPVRLRLVTVR